MNDVPRAVMKVAGIDNPALPEDGAFTTAAKAWAAHALGCMKGERLRRALAVAEALVNYDAMDDKEAP